MEIEQIRNHIRERLEASYGGDMLITPRIVDSFANAVSHMIESGKVEDSLFAVNDVISLESSRNFVRQRQPNLSPVPVEVVKDVYGYLKRELPSTEIVAVMRKSNHPEDGCLYAVVAQDKKDFMCWTCWNQDTESLNFGHYGIGSFNDACEIIKDNFNDMTDDMEHYGPQATLVEVTQHDRYFLKADLAGMLLRNALASDEVAEMAPIMQDKEYRETHEPDNKHNHVYGFGLTQRELYALMEKADAGEDISREFATSVLGIHNGRREILTSDPESPYRRNDMVVQSYLSEDGFCVSYGAYERTVGFHEILSKCRDICQKELKENQQEKPVFGLMGDVFDALADDDYEVNTAQSERHVANVARRHGR